MTPGGIPDPEEVIELDENVGLRLAPEQANLLSSGEFSAPGVVSWFPGPEAGAAPMMDTYAARSGPVSVLLVLAAEGALHDPVDHHRDE